MQLKHHNWIVSVLLILMYSDTIQCQFLDDSDFSNYYSNMNFNTKTQNNMNTFDDVDEEADHLDNSHNFYSILKSNMPHSIITSFMDSSLAPEAIGDCAEPDKSTPDTTNSSQSTENVTEKCVDGDTTAITTTASAPTEECKTDSTDKKTPLKLLMKTLMPSGSTSSTPTTQDSSTVTMPTSTEASPTEVTTAAITSTTSTSLGTTTTLETPVANTTSSNVKGNVESLPTSSSSTFSTGSDSGSKAKELQQLVQHLYIAQARVQLEATEIRKAQSVANTAQQHLEEAANRVRSIISALQSAQQEVASAAIRAQTAQLQLAAHDQLLFAARQDVDALSSQMVGLQAAEGFIQPKATFDVTALLERLKKPLTNAERPTAVPPIVPIPKIKTKRLAIKNSPYGLESPYYD